jgi:hypothetical protein
MGGVVTQLMALGALPAALALTVFFTTRELLSWPLAVARLGGLAVAVLLAVIGNELCKRFLAANDRNCEPREVGRFLAKLTSLHVLSGLTGLAAYLLAARALHFSPQWLCYGGAVLAGGVCYGIFGWISFSETDPHRAGRRLLQKGGVTRAGKKGEEPEEGSVLFAGLWVKFKDTVDHFVVMGATNTGKTLIQRMLMQTALKNIGKGRDQRAVVFDAKQDVLSILAGMPLQCRVVTLDPFDARGHAWDMAKDIRTRLDAHTLAENLVPPDPQASQKFFDDTVRSLYEEVIVTFQKTAPGDWTFRDVIYTLRSRERLEQVLGQTVYGREMLELAFGSEETAQNILATLNTRTTPYSVIASHWDWAKDEGRMVSLTDWLSDEYVLVLGNSHLARPAVEAINQVLFTRLTQLILSQGASKTRRSWIFLDEVRQAGPLKSLTSFMVEGRSRGACVVLGFQDVQGMRAVHTALLADEIIGQAHHTCVTKIINPDSAEFFSRMIGEHDVIEKDESITDGPQGRSRTVSKKRVRRPAAMPSEIMGIPMPSPERGLSFYVITAEPKVYYHTMPGTLVASILLPPNEDPAQGGMPNRIPVPDDREEIRPWTATDFTRLHISPLPSQAPAPSNPLAQAPTASAQQNPRRRPWRKKTKTP